MTDLDALTLTLYGEARGEPIEGLIGVAMVIRNRVRDKYRGAMTYADVCLATEQFSCWIEEAAFLATAEALLAATDRTLPAPLLLCQEVARATIAGTLTDNTLGANHYVTTALYASDPPSWLRGIPPLCYLGHQVFFSVA